MHFLKGGISDNYLHLYCQKEDCLLSPAGGGSTSIKRKFQDGVDI
jgi:hypothetical protein